MRRTTRGCAPRRFRHVRQTASVGCGLAVALHLIDMICDPINFRGRIFDRLGGAIRGLGRFVRRVDRLCGRLFRARRRLLRFRGGSFGLLRLLLVVRCAS